ncbi:MAG: PH domain-containing protein [Acidimicrobiales bacterium]
MTPEPPPQASDPPPQASEWRPLNPRITVLWRCTWFLAGVPVGVLVTVAVLVAAGPVGGSWFLTALVPVLVAAAVGGAGSVLWVPRRYAAWRYRFGPDALEIERGVIWRTISAVPYQRIQQVEIEHGPIQRRLGMVSLRAMTAAALSLASLPGISTTDAGDLRSWLLHRAGRDDGA